YSRILRRQVQHERTARVPNGAARFKTIGIDESLNQPIAVPRETDLSIGWRLIRRHLPAAVFFEVFDPFEIDRGAFKGLASSPDNQLAFGRSIKIKADRHFSRGRSWFAIDVGRTRKIESSHQGKKARRFDLHHYVAKTTQRDPGPKR